MYPRHSNDIIINLPFYECTDFELIELYQTCRQKINSLTQGNIFSDLIKNTANQSNPLAETIETCDYYDEDKIGNIGHSLLNNKLKIYAFNIRSLSRNAGKLLAFLSNLPECDILVLTEIGIWNIEVAVNYFSHFVCDYKLPARNSFGGVGIFVNKSISRVNIKGYFLEKTCNCSKCDFESLHIDFEFANIEYTVCGIYRHPNGNVAHFNADLENAIDKTDKLKTILILGDINIDLIKHDNENTFIYYTMLLSHHFLPLITLPTRITSHSATCLDHIFIKSNKKGLATHKTPGILFCDITDHLATFLFINHHDKQTKKSDQW